MAAVWEMLVRLDFWGWVFLCGIVAIVVQGVVVIAKMRLKHTERMAMIEQGMDPGPVDKAYEKDEI